MTLRKKFVPTPEQQEKTKLRRERFRAIVKIVSGMSEEQRTELINRLGAIIKPDGRMLSAFNSCLILSQNPNASIVAGLHDWGKQGRRVRKGETGLMIWIPTQKRGVANPAPNQADSLNDGQLGFFIGTVFDLGQTDPIEQPECEIDGGIEI